MPPVLLALGSNLGHRINQLHNARQALLTRVTIAAASSIYETDPLYIPDQPTFLNMAIRGSTNLSPQELLEFVKQCESDLGRTDSVRFGPRVIDIDIIDYDGIALNLPDLIIPHPRLQERAFVLQPLSDIAPHWRHPRTALTAQELLKALPRNQGLRPYAKGSVIA